MPWEGKTVEGNRKDFVCEAIAKNESLSALCRKYQITRKIGYKWLKRFENGEALKDRSRKPFHTPNKTPEANETLVLSKRNEHPTWGPRKLLRNLEDSGYTDLPATTTISDILKRNNRIEPEESFAHTPYIRFEREEPNELWQLDYKGDFAMLNKQRCFPLTVLDDHSRYSLAIDAKPNQQAYGVFETFNRVFSEYGLPKELLCDNATPWTDNTNGYTLFEIWLMQLNILPIHGRAWHPQTQGKEERFHRTLKEDLLKTKVFKDLPDSQANFDKWRYMYNNERPHEALSLDVPAKHYKTSKLKLPSIIKEPEYDDGNVLRKVNCKGYISINRHRYYLSESFIGKYVQLLNDVSEQNLRLIYGNFQIGKIDLSQQLFISRRIYRK
jgi:transposase InsO family protein